MAKVIEDDMGISEFSEIMGLKIGPVIKDIHENLSKNRNYDSYNLIQN